MTTRAISFILDFLKSSYFDFDGTLFFEGFELLLVLLLSRFGEGMPVFRLLGYLTLPGCSSIVDPQKLCSR